MASTTILSDNGASSGSAGLKQTAGNDGVLILQTTTSGGTATTAVSIDTSQNVSIGGSVAGQKLNVKGIVALEAISGSTNNWVYYTYTDSTLRWNYNGSGADELVLNTNGVIALKNASTTADGIGITFPASQSASTDANTLDDYEEGTFTPTFTCGSGSVTLNGSYNTLAYTKVGRVVTITGYISITSVSSPAGTLTIGNFPFAMANIGNASTTRPSIHVYMAGSGAPATSYYPAFIAFGASSTSGALYITYNATYTNSSANWVGAGSDCFINFSYICNT